MGAVQLRDQYDKRGFIAEEFRQLLGKSGGGRADGRRVDRIAALAEKLRDVERDELLEQTAEWREMAQRGQLEIDAIVEKAFAMVMEASRRTTGLVHYREQLLGGLALVGGAIAEMATGEGKTLAISLPAYVFGLFGKGAHVVTVNSYLAERDQEFSAPIFSYLGLTSALLPDGPKAQPADKRAAYLADITYGVGYEFGFDYMRDQLTLLSSGSQTGSRERLRAALRGEKYADTQTIQRERAYAIIDEVDSVLIDEAGSPLIISEAPGADENQTRPYVEALELAESFIEGEDYEMGAKEKSLTLTHEGMERVRSADKVPWELLRRPWLAYVLNALRAELFFHRDSHYVIDEEDSVVIIDEFTGRRHKERTWRAGLHQAVEAKERVEIQPESDASASITRQRYFGGYEVCSGLTGTGAESAGEFWRFFKMPVRPIPLHKPSQRDVAPQRVFRDQDSMYKAVVKDVAERQKRGQPVLIGTRTIRASESLAEYLVEAEIEHQILTAKQDEEENELIAGAGRAGSVLLATNMAGRGAHIDLDKQALKAGGLHVIAVERNESVRIDRQLIGRGARQGQPGGAQVYVSAEDYIIETYGPKLAERIGSAAADENGELRGDFNKAIDRVQSTVERLRFEQRLGMARHDSWLEDIKANLA